MIVNENYWNNFTVTDDDLEAIYNFLLETESPLDKFDLTRFLIDRTIQNLENSLLKEEKSRGESYLPEKEYKPGDILRFPARNYATGKVTSVRSGNNPDFPELQVIDVEMATGESTLFAANLRDHKLNHPTPVVKQSILTVTRSTKNSLPSFPKDSLNDVPLQKIWFVSPTLFSPGAPF
jgi:hypothetical protein